MNANQVVINTSTRIEIIKSLSEKLKSCDVYPDIAEQICLSL
jgi:hypothetical protein